MLSVGMIQYEQNVLDGIEFARGQACGLNLGCSASWNGTSGAFSTSACGSGERRLQQTLLHKYWNSQPTIIDTIFDFIMTSPFNVFVHVTLVWVWSSFAWSTRQLHGVLQCNQAQVSGYSNSFQLWCLECTSRSSRWFVWLPCKLYWVYHDYLLISW